MSLLDLGNTKKRIPTSMNKKETSRNLQQIRILVDIGNFPAINKQEKDKRCMKSPNVPCKTRCQTVGSTHLFAYSIQVFLSSAKRVVENHHVHHLRPIEVILVAQPTTGFFGGSFLWPIEVTKWLHGLRAFPWRATCLF